MPSQETVNKPLHEGFTLIELSLVLVIIGLIIGGVLVGRDLIKSAELRATVKQIEEFKTASNTFRIKYNYLPGDIPPSDAAQLGFFTFTGTNAGKSASMVLGAPYGSAKYGFGNNNGIINQGEHYAFWQHLSEAKLIGGQYGGVVGGANYLQTNTATISSGGVPVNAITTYDIFLPQTKLNGTNNNHMNVLDPNPYTTKVMIPNNPFLNSFFLYVTPNQEYAIDNKIDDGFPDKGNTRDFDTYLFLGLPSANLCATNATPNVYNLSPSTADIDQGCNIYMLW